MWGKFLGGFLVGTTVGVVAGMLAAPSAGKTTRKNIVNKSRAYSQQAIDAVRQYLENLKRGEGERQGVNETDEAAQPHGI